MQKPTVLVQENERSQRSPRLFGLNLFANAKFVIIFSYKIDAKVPHSPNPTENNKEDMNMETRDISQVLSEQSSEYKSLMEQHRTLEDRLQELSSRLYLSDTEKLEEVTLKKKKLVLKDRMHELQKQHQS